MRSGVFVVVVFAALSGCIPLKQSHVTGGRQYDSFLYLDDLDCGLLQVGPSNVPKAFKIVDTESFAVAPDGTRYGIATDPHGYDLRSDKDAGVHYVRDRVYLLDAKGRRVTRDWKDGSWQFHIVMDGAQGRDVRDLTLDLRTFNYNPVLHGPPN